MRYFLLLSISDLVMDYRNSSLFGVIFLPYWGIRFDLQDNILYFPHLWETFHNRPLGRADWTFILGWHQKGLKASTGKPLLWSSTSGLVYFVGLGGSFLGLTSGPVSLIFRTLSDSMS